MAVAKLLDGKRIDLIQNDSPLTDKEPGLTGIRLTSDGSVYAKAYGAAEKIIGDGNAALLSAALIPVAVADLAGAPNGGAPTTAIDLTWTYTAVGFVANFKLYRKTGIGGSYALIDSPVSGATSFADTGLTTGTEYYYRLDAVNDYFETAGNEAIVSTD